MLQMSPTWEEPVDTWALIPRDLWAHTPVVPVDPWALILVVLIPVVPLDPWGHTPVVLVDQWDPILVALIPVDQWAPIAAMMLDPR